MPCPYNLVEQSFTFLTAFCCPLYLSYFIFSLLFVPLIALSLLLLFLVFLSTSLFNLFSSLPYYPLLVPPFLFRYIFFSPFNYSHFLLVHFLPLSFFLLLRAWVVLFHLVFSFALRTSTTLCSTWLSRVRAIMYGTLLRCHAFRAPVDCPISSCSRYCAGSLS